MAKTSVGAIYATNSKMLQRIFVPDFDDAEIDTAHVGSGETLIRIPLADYVHGGQKAVQAFIGIPTHSGRCAVVHKESRRVIDVIMADPEIYRHPEGHLVIQDDQARHRDFWNGKEFKR